MQPCVAATPARVHHLHLRLDRGPKGVEIDHVAIGHRLAWVQRDHQLTASDAVLYKTPATFDVSVWELLWPLRTGARMVIARPGGHRDPEYLRALISAAGVTVAHFVPSMLDAYLDVVAPQVSPRREGTPPPEAPRCRPPCVWCSPRERP